MAWNGSGGVEPTHPHSRSARSVQRTPRQISFIAAQIAVGLILLAVVTVAVVRFCSDSNPQGRASEDINRKVGKIAEVSPVVQTNHVQSEQSLPLAMKRDHSELSREELMSKVPAWAYTVEDRKRIDPGYEKRHERFLKRIENNPWKTFADNALAALLFNNGRLGNMPPFNEKFKTAFLKSIQSPAIPLSTDSPELQEKKRLLNETKIWLKDQLDSGEDIVALLNEEYNRQKKVTALEDTLRRELFQLQKTAKSIEEVDDYVAAANKMLEDAGATRKIKFPTLMTKARLQREMQEQEVK